MNNLLSPSVIRNAKFSRILRYLVYIGVFLLVHRFLGSILNRNANIHNQLQFGSKNEIQMKNGQYSPNGRLTSFTSHQSNAIEDESIPDASETEVFMSELKPSWRLLYGKAGDRDAMIELHHACINQKGGLFLPIVNNQKLDDPPAINIGGSDRTLDVMIQIPLHSVTGQDKATLFSKERPLFTLGGIWSSHLSHWFVNNFTPLVNVMNYYYKSKTNWLASQRDLFLGGDMNAFDAKSLHFTQIIKQGYPINQTRCYDRVVVGLNSTCDCCGCLKEYEDRTIYAQVREMVLKTHLSPQEFARAMNRTRSIIKDRPFHVVIVQRRYTRRILNLGQVQEYLTSKNISHEVVELEDYSFVDQVRLFSLNATCIIAAHGNAIGNGWWLPPASLLLEIHSYSGTSLWFEHIWSAASREIDQAMLDSNWRTSRTSGSGCSLPHGQKVHYYKIRCESEECKAITEHFNANMHVELKKLEVILDNYLVWNGISDDGI